MSFYRTGTLSLTNGSTAITGTGTDFINGAAVGECVQAPDGKLYEISTIISATGLTLGQAYLGSTASGQTYSIVPTQSYIRDLAGQAAALVNGFTATRDNAFLKTAADKPTPIDADSVALRDSVSGLGRLTTWANIKATLKAYLSGVAFPIGSTTPAAGAFTTLSTTSGLSVTGLAQASNLSAIGGVDQLPASSSALRLVGANTGNFRELTFGVDNTGGYTWQKSFQQGVGNTGHAWFSYLTEVMRLDAYGNLGLGGVPTGRKLETWHSTVNKTRFNHGESPSDYSEISFGLGGVSNAAAIRSYRTSSSFVGNEGDLRFYTYSGDFGGAEAPETMRLDQIGSLLPGGNGTQSFGTTSLRWAQVWCTAGAFNTSDARLKTEVTLLNEAEKKAAAQFSKEIGTFQWLESVQIKGADKARHHVGFTVQRAKEILESFGLDPWSYGFMSYDAWDDEFVEHPAIEAVDVVEAVLDEDGKVITPAVEEVEAKAAWTEQTKKAGDAYAFRYDQLNLFVAAGISYRLAALEAA